MSEGKTPHPSAPPAPNQAARLKDLDARLRHARGGMQPPATGNGPGGKPATAGLGMAFRIGTELVAALAVGVGIGFVLDRWLDTGPWLMVVFTFLGAGAGMLNVYRVASGIGLAAGYRKAGEETAGSEPEEATKRNGPSDGPE